MVCDPKTRITYPRTGKRGVPQQFPRRLYEMLESETKDEVEWPGKKQFPKIIEWSPTGRAFRIVNLSLFSNCLLPKYFRTKNFSSFQRNLNLYGFFKIRRGPDANMYAHPAFIRDAPHLLSELMKCKKASEPSTAAAQYRGPNANKINNSVVFDKEAILNSENVRKSLKPQSMTMLHYVHRRRHDATHNCTSQQQHHLVSTTTHLYLPQLTNITGCSAITASTRKQENLNVAFPNYRQNNYVAANELDELSHCCPDSEFVVAAKGTKANLSKCAALALISLAGCSSCN